MLKRKEHKKFIIINSLVFERATFNLGILNQETFAKRCYINNVKIRDVTTCISARCQARCLDSPLTLDEKK